MGFFAQVFRPRLPRPRRNSRAYKEAKEAARVLVAQKLVEWNAHYGFEYKRVFIRNTKTRWGTCSKIGNLGFNYRIVYLPSHVADYIIVHELCHLKEFNHQKAFWDLVAETIPDHKAVRKELKTKYLF
jgi:predicted metal-dependent hydrolase